MEWIVLWIVCAIVSAVIASAKGRSPFGWFLLGLLLSLIAVILVAALPSLKPPPPVRIADAPPPPLGTMKTCPRCAEQVKAAAVVCRYCGYEFPAPAEPEIEPAPRSPAPPATAARTSPILHGIVMMAIIAISIAVLWRVAQPGQGTPPPIQSSAGSEAVTEASTPEISEETKAALAEALGTAPAAATPPPLPARSAWRVSTDVSKVDDSSSVYLSVRANGTIPGDFTSHRPTLWIRCVENTTAFLIDFDGEFVADIQGYGDVTFRVDDKPAFTRHLRESTNNEALGLWSGGTAIPMARSLFGGEVLFVRATPFNESAVEFDFDIAGLEKAIEPLREACHW